jgi:metallo-beta-lactamase family protein
MTTSLTFLGATETVTGSRFLLEHDDKRLLIDCGLFQGLKKLRLMNRAPFPVDPASIDAVLLTHAHIDHSGYIPALCNNGFRGRIYCTHASRDLCRILLPDAGHLQEEEAERANRKGYTRHKPALPLYTEMDAFNSLHCFEAVDYNSRFSPVEGISVNMTNAGHILGSACIHVYDGSKNIVFTGDVGRPDDPVMNSPDSLKDADYLVVESTYGDRRHERVDPGAMLESVITHTLKKGGVILIPTFAVGRAQTLLYLIGELISTGKIPKIPLYLDSPMAITATDLFYRYNDQHKLSAETCRLMDELVTCTRSVEESKAIAARNGPKIILSASGMLTGGRVLHHLKLYVREQRNTIVFVGYQAAGTRGANMLAGAESIKVHGNYVPVRAKLVSIDALSAHADYVEMAEWLSSVRGQPRKTFIVHGEPQSQDAFRRYLADQLGWSAVIPSFGDSVQLD